MFTLIHKITKSIKLNRLNANELDSKSANQVRGGYNSGRPDDCCCGCLYANTGGSSYDANGKANEAVGKKTPGVQCLPEVEILDKNASKDTTAH